MTEAEKMLKQLDPDKVLNQAQKQGADYVDVRMQLLNTENIRVENKSLEEYKSSILGGYGIRVIIDGAIGYSSSSDFDRKTINETIKTAIKVAKSYQSKRGILAKSKTIKKQEKVKTKIDPVSVSPEEKISLALESNKAAWVTDEVKNVVTMLGSAKDFRFFQSSDGTQTKIEIPILGIGQMSAAAAENKMELTYHAESSVGGYEFITKNDWNDFAVDVAKLAIQMVKADAPKAGTYPIIADPRLVGVLIHEAFGHAAEADLVFTGTSTLKDRLGEELASKKVTVIDEGTIEGGYPIPFDDEGTPKTKTTILEKGVLKGYLHDRNTANELNVAPTGNCRAQDFQNQPIVRMTNTYIANGDMSFEELLEDIDEGIYIKNKGSTGGQVEVGMGTFTFNGGESYMIRKGELAEPIRGVVISGAILDTLKTVDAVGNDLEIVSSYFGACGKSGQAAKVGFGGPHLRVQKMTVGGK